jgi:hypothetical protein
MTPDSPPGRGGAAQLGALVRRGVSAAAGGIGLAVLPDRLAEGRLLASALGAVLARGAPCLVVDARR